MHTPPALLQVQAELDKVLPALQAAEEALNVLTKKDISELKVRHAPGLHGNGVGPLGSLMEQALGR